MTTEAKRISGFADLDEESICYWKVGNGDWMLYLPECGMASLALHKVIEHESGVITVIPSIKVTSHKGERHGYLERGLWREVE